MKRVLFVCLGNICRSPSAEIVFKTKALTEGLPVESDSAGTAGWHEGNPPYDHMQKAARARGYDMSALRARQVRPDDFHDFDLIIGMDDQNIEDLQSVRPDNATAELKKFTDFAPDSGMDHVPDPYYTRDFEGALKLIEEAADGLIATFRS